MIYLLLWKLKFPHPHFVIFNPGRGSQVSDSHLTILVGILWLILILYGLRNICRIKRGCGNGWCDQLVSALWCLMFRCCWCLGSVFLWECWWWGEVRWGEGIRAVLVLLPANKFEDYWDLNHLPNTLSTNNKVKTFSQRKQFTSTWNTIISTRS